MAIQSEFVFVRHGQTDWNVDGRFQGRTDIPLNAIGFKQAQLASKALSGTHVDLLVSSPLTRALDTAKILAKELDTKIEIDELLIECDFGSLEGVPINDEMQRHGITELEQLKGILASDGEQWLDILLRSKKLLERWLNRNQERKIVFVGHDAILQSISEELSGHWFKSKHAVPYLYQLENNQWERSEII